MDSRYVNREIRRQIWPNLKELGFERRTARNAWRHIDDRVEVVNFQSFSRYNADVMDITTFSFSVNLGCYLTYVPPQWPPKKIDKGRPYPSEAECSFRGKLRPTTCSAESDELIWFVDNAGDNLLWCLNDVKNQIPNLIDWFEKLSSKEEVLRILQEQQENMAELWGFGNLPSPQVGLTLLDMLHWRWVTMSLLMQNWTTPLSPVALHIYSAV